MQAIIMRKMQRMLFGLMGVLIFLAMAGQLVQAREGDGDATGLSVQASTSLPAVGLTIDLIAAQVDEQDTAPFDETAPVLNLSAVGGAVTADVITAHTQHQPFQNLINSDASTSNLAALLSMLGVTLVDLGSTTLASDAEVSGSCGSFAASGGATIENLNLTLLGQVVAASVTSTPDPDTVLFDSGIDGNIVVDTGGNTITANALVILNEQTVAGDDSNIAVNALHIILEITVTGLVNLSQTVEIIVSHAEAGFVNCNDINLSVNKTTNLGGNAMVGVPFDYTVTISETTGNADATNVQFTDTLDTETTFLSFINKGGGTCSHNAGTITCQWQTVPANDSVSATYRVNPTAAGTASNNVIVTTGDNDIDINDNSDTETVTVDTQTGTPTDLAVSFVNTTPADGQVGVPQSVDINVTNTGAAATNATLVYTVSPDVTIDSVDASVGWDSCLGVGTTTLTCQAASLADGFDETVSVTITPLTPGPNTHTVNVTSEAPDNTPGNNTAEATVNVTAPASNVSLQASISDSPDPGTEGEPVTYTIDVSNTGTDPANNVVLDVDLGGVPLTVDSATPGQGSCTIMGTQVVCDLGTLPANGGTTQIEIVAIPGGTGTLTLDGTAEDDAGNSAPVSEDTVIEAAEADLSITKVADAPKAFIGHEIVYTLEVTNNGPNAASDIVVSDTLPPEVAYVSATPSQGFCIELDGVLTCQLGMLASGDMLSITLVVEALDMSTTGNAASVSSSTNDPDITNNTSAEVVVVIVYPVPTLSEYARLALMLMLAFMALLVLRIRMSRQRR